MGRRRNRCNLRRWLIQGPCLTFRSSFRQQSGRRDGAVVLSKSVIFGGNHTGQTPHKSHQSGPCLSQFRGVKQLLLSFRCETDDRHRPFAGSLLLGVTPAGESRQHVVVQAGLAQIDLRKRTAKFQFHNAPVVLAWNPKHGIGHANQPDAIRPIRLVQFPTEGLLGCYHLRERAPLERIFEPASGSISCRGPIQLAQPPAQSPDGLPETQHLLGGILQGGLMLGHSGTDQSPIDLVHQSDVPVGVAGIMIREEFVEAAATVTSNQSGEDLMEETTQPRRRALSRACGTAPARCLIQPVANLADLQQNRHQRPL